MTTGSSNPDRTPDAPSPGLPHTAGSPPFSGPGAEEIAEALRNLATSFVHLSGRTFFEAVSKHVASVVGVDFVFIGRLDDTQREVTVLGGWARGAPMGDLTYALADTPCEGVMGKEACYYASGVQALFPKDLLLAQMGVEGYLGSPIFDKGRRPLGIMVALHTRPLEQAQLISHLFNAYVDHVSAEMQREAAQTALRQSEAKFAKAFNASPAAISLARIEDGRYVEVNDQFVRTLGYSREETIGRTSAELQVWVEPGDRERFIGALSAAGSLRNFETPFRMRSGEVRHFLVSSESIDIEGVPHSLNFITDITERKRSEEALRRSEQRYRRLYDSMFEAIVSVDMDGRLIEFNPVYQSMLGYPEDELRKLTYVDLTPEKWHASEEQIVREQVLQNGYSDVYEKEYRRRDGTLFPVELRTFLLRDDAGKPAGMWAIVRDVTARKHAEGEQRRLETLLVQAQKMEAVGQLAGGVAHDFNNIISAILMQLNLLDQDEHLPADLHDSLRELESEARRASDLTRQLLTFSRRQVMQPKTLELNELIGNLLKMLRRLIGEHIALDFSASPGDLWLAADAGMLEQVIMNLVVNARDAMPHGGRVTIRARALALDAVAAAARGPEARPGRFVTLEVIDVGTGMDPETARHIFEPFFTTKGVGKGTGLGLSTVYGIVRQHDGWIELETAVGAGTTFRIVLPGIEEAKGLIEGAAVEESAVGGHETVMLVEDDATVRRMLARALERLGYRVQEAQNGVEAQDLWQRAAGGIDLLLSDMVMPGGVSGLDLAQQCLREKPGLKVILMSGYSPDLADGEWLKSHGIDFLPKPLGQRALARALRAALDRP